MIQAQLRSKVYMSYFAKIENGIVTQVIAIEQDVLNLGHWGDPTSWVQTSYNTYGNVHYAPSPPAAPMTPDGGTPLHKNYAGIGYSWDGIGFAAPQPYPSWILNSTTYLWEAPTPPGPAPTTGGPWLWDEATVSWVL